MSETLNLKLNESATFPVEVPCTAKIEIEGEPDLDFIVCTDELVNVADNTILSAADGTPLCSNDGNVLIVEDL